MQPINSLNYQQTLSPENFSSPPQTETTIACLPRPILCEIFELLGGRNNQVKLTCKAFYSCFQDLRLQQARKLCKMNAFSGLLSSVGISCPETVSNGKEAFSLLIKTRSRIRIINRRILPYLRCQFSIKDLVINADKLKLFLQNIYTYSFGFVISNLAEISGIKDKHFFDEHSVSYINNLILNTENVVNIRFLSILSYNLVCLPKEIKFFTNLEKINLKNNYLASLPSEISTLTKLEFLNIGGNQFTSLPPEVEHLPNLRHLKLYSNCLSSLSAGIGNLTQLYWLDLRNNCLSCLPPEIGNLKTLKGLVLSNNRLTTLPMEMEKLVDLEFLDLKGNQIDRNHLLLSFFKKNCNHFYF